MKDFMDEYKHLEKLCSEMYGEKYGVSLYIKDMQETPNRVSRNIPGWDADLRMLKKLRHIRNSLAHDTDENTVSYDSNDINNIRYFYNLIMQQQDPLALCKKQSESNRSTKQATHASDIQTIRRTLTANKKQHNSWALPVIIGVTVLLSIMLALILYYTIVMMA